MLVNTDRFLGMGGDAKYNEIKIAAQHKTEIQNIYYDKNLSIPIEIVGDSVLTDEQVREIYVRYFNLEDYKNFYINAPEWSGLHFECTINDVEKIYGGTRGGYGVVGFKALMNCNAPWMFEEETTKTYDSDDIGVGMSFVNTSDSRDYMYPIISIKVGATGGNISIVNDSDNNEETAFTSVGLLQTITVNPDTGRVTSTSQPEIIFSKFNKKYFRLVPGENIFNISGNCIEFKITYKNARVIV